MLKRHTLLFLTQSGIEYAWEHQKFAFPSKEKLQNRQDDFLRIPAIVRRERSVGSQIPIGISFPVREQGSRWRIASSIPDQGSFDRVITPEQAAFQCIRRNTLQGKFMREAVDAAAKYHISLGLFGSLALESVTGLPYTHPDSDLDLIAVSRPGADLLGFECKLEELQKKFGLRADTELSFGNGYYGKLKELFSGQKTILAKGDVQPKLLLCHAVRETLYTAD